ncbi:MAG: LysM peptidoglycan-binding domain-containing protein, partial [Myxococcota bacterium]
MATKRYTVVFGDYLAKIAMDHGTTVGAIWNHPQNHAHRQKRASPDELYPGDVLFIPVPAPPPEPAPVPVPPLVPGPPAVVDPPPPPISPTLPADLPPLGPP